MNDVDAFERRLLRRFWARVAVQPPRRRGMGPCWHWTGAINAGGYPKFTVKFSTVYAHRWAYERFVGPIPDGGQVDHVCHTRDAGCPGGPGCLHRRCVNPAHLDAVTNAENSRRAADRRRLSR